MYITESVKIPLWMLMASILSRLYLFGQENLVFSKVLLKGLPHILFFRGLNFRWWLFG